MSDTQEATRETGPVDPAPPAPPPLSPAATVQKALDALNHPGNLDLHARLGALETASRTFAAALLPLLPTE